jgi:outer membrane protein TolC
MRKIDRLPVAGWGNLLLRAALRTAAALTTSAVTGLAGVCQAPEQAPNPVRQAPTPVAAMQRPDRPLKVSPGIAGLLGSQAGSPLAIQDAVALALAANRQLAEAAESAMQAHGATTTAMAGQWFNVNATYTLTRNNEAQAVDLGDQSVVMQRQFVSQLIASINLPLDVTGVLRAATNEAQFDEIAAKLDARRVLNDVVLNVKRAFYEALRSEALVMVAETNLGNARTQLADAQVRLGAGTVTRLDVLSAQSAVLSAEQSVRQASNTESQAMASLKNTIGVDVNAPIQLTTEGAVDIPVESGDAPTAPDAVRPLGGEGEPRTAPGRPLGDLGAAQAGRLQRFVVGDRVQLGRDYDALLREALVRRPEIGRAEATIAAAKKGITVSRQSGLPSVSVGYYGAYTPDVTGLSNLKLTGYAILSVTVPIFDAGATRGRIEQARARESSAETDRRTQVDTVTLEVRQACLDLLLSRQQVGTARQELAQADEAFRLAQLRYSAGVTTQAGVSPLIELGNAQSALARAQSDYANAMYDYNLGRSALDRAVGRYTDRR